MRNILTCSLVLVATAAWSATVHAQTVSKFQIALDQTVTNPLICAAFYHNQPVNPNVPYSSTPVPLNEYMHRIGPGPVAERGAALTCQDANNAFTLVNVAADRGYLTFRNKRVEVVNFGSGTPPKEWSLVLAVSPMDVSSAPMDMFKLIKTRVLAAPRGGPLQPYTTTALQHVTSGKCVRSDMTYGALALVDCKDVGLRSVYRLQTA